MLFPSMKSLQSEDTAVPQIDENTRSVIDANKINKSLKRALANIFYGFLITGLFMLLYEQSNALTNVQHIVYPLACMIGCFMMLTGILKILTIKKIGVYVKILNPDITTPLNKLATETNRTEETVKKDLAFFFEKGYLFGEIQNSDHVILIPTRLMQTNTH